MKTLKNRMEEQILEEKIENLIAIGAATASNCIPCFEHIYEKAISSGITLSEIRRASEIAGQVKAGANMAITNTVGELVGDRAAGDLPCKQMADKSCNCR